MSVRSVLTLLFVALVGLSCAGKEDATPREQEGLAPGGHAHDHHGDTATYQVTVWTERFELFAEYPAVVAGEPAEFVTHITDLYSLEPRREGQARFVFKQNGKDDKSHESPAPSRPGIYIPRLIFPDPGDWSLSVLINVDGVEHSIDFPMIKVHASEHGAAHAPVPEKTQGFSYLKEEQWQVPIGTAPVVEEDLHGHPELIIPVSAIANVEGQPVAVVQAAGETFQVRHLTLGHRHGEIAEVRSGLAMNERVVNRGIDAALAAAHRDEIGHDHHDHPHDDAGSGHDHSDEGHSHDDSSGEAHGHDDHHGHGPETIAMTEADAARYGISVDTARSGAVHRTLTLTGEICVNSDRLAHIVPRAPGVVRSVHKKLGDTVKANEVMARIESRALADAKADYLTSLERRNLAQVDFEREERLWKNQISAEQEYLDARQVLAEAKIQLRSAGQKLVAMGFSEAYLKELPGASEAELTRMTIRAPFDGTVIEKHITLGEVVGDDSAVFTVADLSTVWLDLQVHERHLGDLCCGQPVTVTVPPSTIPIRGSIEYIHPIVDEQTRTVMARMSLPNTNGEMRPGTFVTATVATDALDAKIAVSRDAVQYFEDSPVVFVYDGASFTARQVTLGKSDDRFVEVIEGLLSGERFATAGSFRLKAEIDKRTAGDIGHGHVH